MYPLDLGFEPLEEPSKMSITNSLKMNKKRGSRCSRVPAQVIISSRTIGTDASYTLATVDVSASGILCSFDRHGKMPFIVNTILEVTIDPGRSLLEVPLNCLAKVVRRENNPSERNHASGRLGIQILQMDQADTTMWESCVAVLEKKFGRIAEAPVLMIPAA